MADTGSGRNNKKVKYYGTTGGPRKTVKSYGTTGGGPKKSTKTVGTTGRAAAPAKKAWSSPRDDTKKSNGKKKYGLEILRQNTPVLNRGAGNGTNGFMKGVNGGGEMGGISEEEISRMTFAEALALAKEMGYGSGGTDFGAVESQLRGRASEADRRLEAMYRQLGAAYDADAPVIGGQYDQAKAGINDNVDKASANTNAAYDKAREEQTRQMKALGIEDAAAVLAAQGGFAAQDQAGAVSNLEANRAIDTTQATQHKASALNYNTNIKGAGQLEGNLLRATNQSRLSDKLAEVNMQRQKEQAQLQQQLAEAARGIYENDASNYNDRLEGKSREQQELAELLQREEAERSKQAQYQQKQSAQSKQAQAKMYAQLLSTFRSDPNPEKRAKAVMQNMMKAGML